MGVKNVAAVVSGMDEEYPYNIIRGINDFAKQHDININYFAAFGGIIDSKEFDIGEFSIYALPDFSKFDGALLLTNTFANPDIRNLIIDKVKSAGIPSVIFECKDHQEFYDISINNYNVMKKLVDHLINEHGCKTFNFIAGPKSNPEAKERFKAFKDALSENGLEFDKERFYQGLFRSYDGIKAIEDFVKSGLEMPDAFVCANDSMALTAMTCLQRLGYRVPKDVIVTGFDHTFNAKNSYPVLTTAKRPLYHSGLAACMVLNNLMNGVEQPRSTVLEAEPVFSESCGCVPKEIEDIKEFKRNTYGRIERTYTSVHMLNRLIANLAGAQDMGKCVDSIQQMVETIDCDKFSLCLINDWEGSFHTIDLQDKDVKYAKEMTAPLVWDNGERRSVELFESDQLFPEPLEGGGNISYFLPLHFDERYLGYYIMTNCDFPIYSYLCHTMTMSIGNAIEGISKLNVLDPLCKIYNRNGFIRNAEEMFRTCVAERYQMMLCFIDMDGLKKINDSFGHNEGDFAIKEIADAIACCCRRSDLCARFGGDEFIVIAQNAVDGLDEKFETRFQKKLDEINDQINKPYELSASVGSILFSPKADDKLADFIKMADERMYEKKKQKKKART